MRLSARTAGLLLAATAGLLMSAPPAPSAAATGAPALTLAATGDTILGNTPQVPGDPTGYLSPVRAALGNAQVVFGNLEGTLTTASGGKCAGSNGGNCYAFRNPPAFSRAYAATGFTVLNTANNHSHDYGQAGLRDTLSAIGSAGMTYSGQPGQVDYVNAGRVRVAVVAFAPYSSSNNLLDLPTAQRLIRQAHSQAPVVIVYMHAGAEGANASHVNGREEYYAGEDRGNARAFAHMAIDNGAAAVIASGPHVLRGVELYRGHPVAYSLGNFASYGNFDTSGALARSAVLRLGLTSSGGFVSGRLISVQLDRGGRATVGGDSVAFVDRLSAQDFGSAAPRFARDGSFTAR